jgi:hypothetical protein
MSNNILFIFEGANTEVRIINNLQKYFINENVNVHCVYGGEIYQIFKKIKDDDDLDTFSLLKERSKENEDILKNFNRDDFAEIYLFFDYDGHSKIADDKKIKELLTFFNEETEKGKLFISYPMVESLKHVISDEDFQNSSVECKENINYKKIVSEQAQKHLIDFSSYDIKIWKELISLHLKKMNNLCVSKFTLPDQLFTQIEIFQNQKDKFITPHKKVSILSAFPVFIHDYYGNEKTKSKIK